MGENNNKLIVVLGMHRSGTSAITRGLQVMGVELGDKIMPPVEGNNPKGFWEDIDLNALDVEMLSAIGSDWFHVSTIKPIDVEILRKQGYFHRAVELLRQKVVGVPVFGFKDPRVAKLLPFWQEVFGHCQFDVSYLLVVRHPLSVIKSLNIRDGFEPEQSCLLWLGHVITSLNGSAGGNRVLVDYDRLLQAPALELRRVAKCAGLQIEPAEMQSYQEEFLDQSLRHTVYELKDLLSDDACLPLVGEVYAALLDVASEKSEIDDPELQDKVLRWSDEFERLGVPLLLVDKLLAQKLSERDAMLEDKDAAWTARLEQTAHDFEAEIARVGAERDAMLEDKNVVLRHIAPDVSVVTVNFNGKKFLPELLRSLAMQNLLPTEIIVVDNASSDGSVEFLQEHFPYVRIVRSDINLGFAGGNNLGVRAATSPLVALINNDAIVAAGWLEHLVGSWVSHTANGEKIGAVSPKIRFMKKFLSLRFSSGVTPPPNGDDGRTLGVALDFDLTRIVGSEYVKPIVVSGFHGEECWPDNRVVRWTTGNAELLLPTDDVEPGMRSVLNIVAMSCDKTNGVALEVYCAERYLGSCRVTNEFTEFNIEIPADLMESAGWVINNAGSKLDRFGNAADIGINQLDHGQFDAAMDLEAFCGCSVLMPRNLFLAQNGFDERFFMYYEDTDLSWRLRRSGYRIVFEPHSVVQHIHAGSSSEWSPSFRYYVTRNYRLNGFKNASLPQLIYLMMIFIYAFMRKLSGVNINTWFQMRKMELNAMSPAQIELKALVDAFSRIPFILFRRTRNFLKKGLI